LEASRRDRQLPHYWRRERQRLAGLKPATYIPLAAGIPRSAELFGADQQDDYEEYQDSEGDHHDSKKDLLFPWALARYLDLILGRNET
jgi:hypothetical protein